MAEPIEINDLGSLGVITDTPAYLIPPEAMTQALNVGIVDNGYEKRLGWEQIFGTPTAAPHFALPIRTTSTTYWLYVSLTKGYVYDGSSHTNITRQSAGVDVNYTGSETREWNGTLLAAIPILNNGVDIPQFWATTASKLANLTNWPSTLRAKVVRAFGPYLIAFNVTKSGSNYPHMYKWSHPADPGTIPASWDETDPTKDAGEAELNDVNAGLIVDALPLGEIMYIYKENSIWKLRFVGGNDIFSPGFAAWQSTTGLLAPRCVCVSVTPNGARHIFASQDDILWHDGNQIKSLLSRRRKRELFNSIDTQNYLNCFMFDNPLKNEAWFCYPTSGNTNPNRAMVFNYQQGGDQWPITDVDGITFRNGVVNAIQGASDELWSQGTDTWADDTGPWSTLSRRRVVLCSPDNTKFYNLDKSATKDGTVFTGTVQRLGLAVTGKKRTGEWIVDFDQRKLMDRIWAKITGGPVSIRMGSQELVDGPVVWKPTVTHTPSSSRYQDGGPVSGNALCLEVSSQNGFRFDGYGLEVTKLGKF